MRAKQSAESRGLMDLGSMTHLRFTGILIQRRMAYATRDRIFSVICCSDEVKVLYSTFLLLGDAEYWWNGTPTIT